MSAVEAADRGINAWPGAKLPLSRGSSSRRLLPSWVIPAHRADIVRTAEATADLEQHLPRPCTRRHLARTHERMSMSLDAGIVGGGPRLAGTRQGRRPRQESVPALAPPEGRARTHHLALSNTIS
jgi:hypothetical protein